MSYEQYEEEHQVLPLAPPLRVKSPTITVPENTPLPLPVTIKVDNARFFSWTQREEEGRRFADFIFNVTTSSWRDAFTARLKAREASQV